jgi:cysteine-rich repeat protein
MVTPTGSDACASAAVQDPPTFPILADNVLPHTQAFPGPQTFTVTLPTNVTCTKCTLQVLEFMSNHPAPCFYHHCADISIQEELGSCGDGQVQPGEQCDDGNTVSGDGCNSQCRLECGTIARAQLALGKLDTPSGDETLSFQGMLTLPAPVSPALDPLANGVRLQIDAAGTVFEMTVPGGNGWMANKSRTVWTYRNKTPTAPGGIIKVVIRDKSAVAAGLVKFAVNAKAGSFAVASADPAVIARVIIAPAGGQCGDTNFPSCAFNPSGSKLRCK